MEPIQKNVKDLTTEELHKMHTEAVIALDRLYQQIEGLNKQAGKISNDRMTILNEIQRRKAQEMQKVPPQIPRGEEVTTEERIITAEQVAEDIKKLEDAKKAVEKQGEYIE